MKNSETVDAVGEHTHHLWKQQLIDYQSTLRLAQEEEKALTVADFEHLHHTQLHRRRLTDRILKRQQVIHVQGTTLQREVQDLIEEIATTIEAVKLIDKTNTERLEAEHEAIASRLQKHRDERTALYQYKPHRENLPHFLNRMV